MLRLSFGLVVAAAIIGGALAALRMPSRWALVLGAAHGAAGIAGLSTLLLALRGPPRGVAMGVGPFGAIAAVLLAGALIVGASIAWMHLRHRRAAGLLIGIHATIAVSGVVLLAAYTLVG